MSTLLDQLKANIVEILETVVEGNEESFEKHTKYTPIDSGKQLGKSLTERRVKWKVLIFDTFVGNMLIPLLKVGDLKGLGVTLRMNIKDTRQCIPDAPALYLMEPTKENIDILCRDCENALYQSFYINFTTTVSRDLLEDMATSLLESSSSDKISKVYDQFCNFQCVEPKFFTLAQTMPTEESIVSGLMSVLLTMNVIPIISYKQGGSCESIAKKLEQRLKNITLDRTHLHSFRLDSKRPLLVLVDRDIDFNVLLSHKWTYRAMVHDLFGLDQNTVKVPKEVPDQLLTWQTYEIDLQDEFWNNNAGLQFQDFAENLDSTMKQHTKKVNDFNEKTGLKIGQDSEESFSNDKALSQDVVDQVLFLMDGKKRLNTHVNISMAILNEIKVRKIDRLVSIEESIIDNKKFDKKVLQSLVDPSIPLEDRLRLTLICHLSYILHGAPPPGITKQEFDQIIADLEKTVKDQRGTTTLPEINAIKKLCQNTQVTKVEESHFMNMIGSNLKLFGQSIIAPPQNDTLPITKLIGSFEDGIPSGYVSLDKNHKGFDDVVIFVNGSGNYMEYQNLMDYGKKTNKNIHYGCCKIQTGNEFLMDLSQ
jgi:hypothetical protein